MRRQQPLISLVDDDESVRESLPVLLRELGFDVHAFESAEAFLTSAVLERTQCLILDIAMPGMSGLQLQEELESRSRKIPVIFITAQLDNAKARGRDEGAVACLLKPFTASDLVHAVNVALQKESSHARDQ
jgi:FixJ family two-component response regulator